MMKRLLLLGLIILLERIIAYELDIHSEPVSATAGKVFGVQPAVKVLDNQGALDTSFDGYAYAELYQTPTGFEALMHNGSTDIVRVPFVDGYASFDGLYIKETGEGYTLRIVGEDADQDQFAFVVSSAFDVSPGAPFKLEVIGAPSTGFGGTPFALQPYLRIVDAGGNLLEDLNSGTVTATINKNELLPSSMLSQPIRDGYAQFSGLYINEAESNYVITFQVSSDAGIDVSITGAKTSVSTQTITIYVGAPSSLSFWQTLPLIDETDLTAIAGESFFRQPVLRVADAADNTIFDSTASMLVIATIQTNPTGTDFISKDAAFTFIDGDRFIFSNLGLLTVGERYGLRFTLYEYSSSTTSFIDTGIYVDSHRFDVLFGTPYEIRVLSNPSGATAGSTAFPIQPIIGIYDRGGNLLTNENSNSIEADITGSIAISRTPPPGEDHIVPILIDTSSQPVPTFLYMQIEWTPSIQSAGGIAAAGDTITIELYFDADILLLTHDDSTRPTLALTLDNTTAKGAFAILQDQYVGAYTSTPKFDYLVLEGHSTSALDLLAPAALTVDAILDPLGRSVNSTLPVGRLAKGSLANVSNPLTVITTPPHINDLTLVSPLTPGVYAAGTKLIYNLTFDYEVFVSIGVDGGPYLPIANLNASTTNPAYSKYPLAEYVSGSTTRFLVFEYQTQVDEASININEPLAPPVNASLITPTGTNVYRRSAMPTTLADLDIPNNNTSASRIDPGYISISVQAPRVNSTLGIWSLSPNGTYYAGDVIDIGLEFDFAVDVSDQNPPYLALDTGVGVPVAATYLYGAGTKRLVFRYTVYEDDSKQRIDFYDREALQSGGGWVRRLASTPLVDADLSLDAVLSAGTRLSNRSQIAVDGTKPKVLAYGVLLDSNSSTIIANATTYTTDKIVSIQVLFDKAVAVFGSPSLRLDVGSLERTAVYSYGNGTDALIFEYEVQIGDETDRLGLAATISSISLGYSDSVLETNGGAIMLASSSPQVHADLRLLFSPEATRTLGSPVYDSLLYASNTSNLQGFSYIRIDAVEARPTSVLSVEYDDPNALGSSVGVGERLVFAVTFTDEISLNTAPPELQLNTGDRAIWVDGSGTKRWRFRYIVGVDTPYVPRLDLAQISEYIPSDEVDTSGVQRTALWCNVSAGCALKDRAGNAVNLTMQNLTMQAAAFKEHPIEIDTSPPMVSAITCRTPASPYEPGPNGPYRNSHNWYTVGERLEFVVDFDRDVELVGDDGPLLQLDLGLTAGNRFAEFEELETSRRLRFALTVAENDYTTNLTVLAMTDNFGQAELLRRSSDSTTKVNYTLPRYLRGAPVGANGSTRVPIRIATKRVPRVVDVRVADTETYTSYIMSLVPGDELFIEIEFDASVSVNGIPVLLLNSYTDARATYVSGSGTPILKFSYLILEGHSSRALDYTDEYALRRNIVYESSTDAEKLAQRGSILASSSNPTLAAILDLPKPGSLASLAGNSTDKVVVQIDSTVPRLVSLEVLGDQKGYTSAYDIIYIAAVYSAPVAVHGAPFIRLETGAVDRVAAFHNGSNTSLLLFKYTIQPGDYTSALDYYSDVDNFRSSTTAFVISDGSWIRRATTLGTPVVEADSWINPVQSMLISNGVSYVKSSKSVQFEGGKAEYADLAIALYANDYRMRFSCSHSDVNGIVLRTSTDFDVGVSVDTVLRVGNADTFDAYLNKAKQKFGFAYSHAEESGDLFGWSADVDRSSGQAGFLVSCAPGKARPVPEIQLITLTGDIDRYNNEESVLEIQSYAVGILLQPAVQSFRVYSDPGTTLDGTFELSYADESGIILSAAAEIPISADAISLAILLMEAYPDLGLVTASKESYEWCACNGGATWSITFDGLIGSPVVGELRVDTTSLTGSGARASAVSRDIESSYVNGTWRLDMPTGVYSGIEITESLSTRPLSSDASTRDVLEAIEIDLAPLVVKNVDVHETNNYGGRRWAVTFDHQDLTHFTNDVPDLEAVAISVPESGAGATAWSQTIRQGKSPITGSFRVTWRDSTSESTPIPYNASAEEVEHALLTLPSINEIKVSRHEALLGAGLTWRVTFIDINVLDPRTTDQWLSDSLGDLEKIQVTETNNLLGSSPKVAVAKLADVPSWTGARTGSAGKAAGACYSFERMTVSEADDSYSWSPLFALEPQNIDDHRGEPMAFGKSVSFARGAGGFVVVGAPFTEYHGVSEQQLLQCSAKSGTFRLGMQNFWSDPIPANGTIFELRAALLGQLGKLNPLHPTPWLEVVPTGGAITVCTPATEGNRTIITNSTNGTNATGFLITFSTPSSGPGVDGTKVANLDLLNIDASLLDDVYHEARVVVKEVRRGTRQPHGPGALGDARGAAFAYRYDASADGVTKPVWKQRVKLIEIAETREGDRFGWSVTSVASPQATHASDDDDGIVIAIGAPSAGESRDGNVFVFTSQDGVWARVGAPLIADVVGTEEGDEFGYSLDMIQSGGIYTLVVGAPGDDDHAGAAYIFRADGYYAAFHGQFRFVQRLDTNASDVSPYGRQRGDRFGCSVGLDGDDVVIGACGAKDIGMSLNSIERGAEDTGIVFVFQRATRFDLYEFKQRLRPTNNRGGDRFGTAVSIDNGTIIATALQGVRDIGERGTIQAANLRPRQTVWKVETSADSAEPMGGNFRLGWRSLNTSETREVCETLPFSELHGCLRIAAVTTDSNIPVDGRTRWTRALHAFSTALQVRTALEEDLGIGDLYVSRSEAYDLTGSGFEWRITFRSLDIHENGYFEGIPPLVGDGSGLISTGIVTLEVSILNERPEYVRGNGHLFVRDIDGVFVEQCLLQPYIMQRQSLFGLSAALEGDLGAIGAPNTDSDVSGVNAGSISAYDLTFMGVGFTQKIINVTEGDVAELTLARRASEGGLSSSGLVNLLDKRLHAFIFSVARNADAGIQQFFRNLFGLHDSRAVPPGKTPIEKIGAGTAYGRAQYYGGTTNSSQWVDGGRDDLAIADFVPLGVQYIIPQSDSTVTVQVNTTPDGILERPDESIDIFLWLPGMLASSLGELSARIIIEDDGDGLDGSAFTVFDKLGKDSNRDIEELIEVVHRKNIDESDTPLDTTRLAGTVSATYVTENQDVVIVLGAPEKSEIDIYRRSFADGVWRFEATMTNESVHSSSLYATAVAASQMYGRDAETVLVGAPGLSTVFAYVYASPIHKDDLNSTSNGTLVWQLDARFTAKDATSPAHQYGATVAIDGDMAAVGASGLEGVYIYYRKWSDHTQRWTWDLNVEQIIQSSDYDYDMLLKETLKSVHEQGFGVSLSLSGNALAVGAPYADYGNLGSINDIEKYDTNGIDNRKLGKGRVYIFASTPPQLLVTVRADEVMYNGTWRLGVENFRNVSSCLTTELDYDARDIEVQTALDQACISDTGIIAGSISVSRDSTTTATDSGGERRTWTITFLGEVGDPPPIQAYWGSGNGCLKCNPFNAEWAQAPSRQVLVERPQTTDAAGMRGSWTEIAKLQPEDRSSGAQFGASVALDSDLLIVGAPRAAGSTDTTWDFETGDLSGWRRTGTAFNNQPTFGDGPSNRPDANRDIGGIANSLVLEGAAARAARPRGRYFVASADNRPGSIDDYTQPYPDTRSGASDGDNSVGTLTSQSLILPAKGDYNYLGISFLIGGGCDPLTEYVELLIDGVAVARATGKCDERMFNQTWDVTLYAGRAAVLRIVDAAQSGWGHINVDHFVFSWPIRSNGQGEILGGGAASVRKSHFATGGNWAALSGAAYVFQLDDEDWILSTRLTPSDRRAGDFFGASVSIDASSGLAIVGAPFADARTHWQVPPPRRPPGAGPPRDLPLSSIAQAAVAAAYASNDLPNRATPVALPMETSTIFRMSTTTSVREASGARSIWNQVEHDEKLGLISGSQPKSIDESISAGAAYIFDQIPAVITAEGIETTPPRWSAIELAKIQDPTALARDHFGTSVNILPDLILVGSPGDDSFGENAGAAFVYDPHVLRIRFSQAEFTFVEGTGDSAQIFVERDVDDSDVAVTIAYSTEDLSAKGVDAEKVARCREMASSTTREGCGDYGQSMGTVTLVAGATGAWFFVPIIDDLCYEHYPEYVQLTLSVPGAPALVGENFIAKLRIDDDDFAYDACTHNFL